MAAQKLTPQQQRDRRAKIMLAVLGVVLLGVLALQLPKLMHHGGSTAAPPPVAALTAPTAALAAAPAPQQLTRFSRFAPKNPFHAQVTVPATGLPASTPPPTAPKPKPPKPVTKPKPAPITISVTKQPAVPIGPRVPAALLVINGKKHVLPLEQPYPTAHPLFQVLAISEQAVWIQLVDGSLAGGRQTVKLDRGRIVTLENATAGVKVALKLLKATTAPKPVVIQPLTSTTTSVTPAPTTTAPTTTTTGG
jgi:hypothetical protein